MKFVKSKKLDKLLEELLYDHRNYAITDLATAYIDDLDVFDDIAITLRKAQKENKPIIAVKPGVESNEGVYLFVLNESDLLSKMKLALNKVKEDKRAIESQYDRKREMIEKIKSKLTREEIEFLDLVTD